MFTGEIGTTFRGVTAALTRAALRVGFAVSRVRILGSVLKSECAPKEALKSVSQVYKHLFRAAFSKSDAKPVLIDPGDRF